MSGRGRGGRGGRGGWRGRGGRGNGPQRLTDEDGAEVLGFEEGGPPKLFPEFELPPPMDVNDKDKILLLHYRWVDINCKSPDSRTQFREGPYYMRKHQDKQRDFEGEAASGKDGAGGGGDGKAALAFMTLDARYFPEELYSEKDKRQAAKGAQAAGFSFRGGSGGGGDGKEGPDLAQYLSARADAEERQAAAGQADADEDPEDPGAQEMDDTDDNPEEDDYYQGEHFDDDEGYDDDDGGGGGDDAYY